MVLSALLYLSRIWNVKISQKIHFSSTNEERRYPLSIAQLDFEFWIANKFGWYLQLYPQYLKSLDRPSKLLDWMSLDRFLLLPCVTQSHVAWSIFLRLMNFNWLIIKSIDQFVLADFPNGRSKLELWKWWKSSLMYFQV